MDTKIEKLNRDMRQLREEMLSLNLNESRNLLNLPEGWVGKSEFAKLLELMNAVKAFDQS